MKAKLIVSLILVYLPLAVSGQLKRNADEVLLVFNANSPISKAIADDYVLKRRLKNVLSIRCQDSAASGANETIAFRDYIKLIEEPSHATHDSSPPQMVD